MGQNIKCMKTRTSVAYQGNA